MHTISLAIDHPHNHRKVFLSLFAIFDLALIVVAIAVVANSGATTLVPSIIAIVVAFFWLEKKCEYQQILSTAIHIIHNFQKVRRNDFCGCNKCG